MKFNIFKNLLALLLGCCVAFIILEVFLRIYSPIETRVKGNKIVLPANKKYVYQNNKIEKLEKYIIHTKNSLGFRGADPPKEFSDFLTIIVVGGSTTECIYISDGNTWTDLLAQKFNKDFNKIWINNAGLDGHTTYGHIVLMEDYIINIKPKIVLFLIGANDVYIDKMNRYDENKMNKIRMSSLDDLLLSLINVSEVFNLSYRLYSSINMNAHGLAHNNLNLQNIPNSSVQNSKLFEIRNTVKEKYIDEYRKRVNILINLSRENSIEPILITQPALFGNAVDDITGVNLSEIKVNNTNGSFEWEMLELYNDVLRNLGNKMNVIVIDLAREMPKSSMYYYDYYHFTNDGSKKVSDIIYKEIYLYLNNKYDKYK